MRGRLENQGAVSEDDKGGFHGNRELSNFDRRKCEKRCQPDWIRHKQTKTAVGWRVLCLLQCDVSFVASDRGIWAAGASGIDTRRCMVPRPAVIEISATALGASIIILVFPCASF